MSAVIGDFLERPDGQIVQESTTVKRSHDSMVAHLCTHLACLWLASQTTAIDIFVEKGSSDTHRRRCGQQRESTLPYMRVLQATFRKWTNHAEPWQMRPLWRHGKPRICDTLPIQHFPMWRILLPPEKTDVFAIVFLHPM